MNHDVFISYSSRNKATALAICHVLEEHRIRCWMAPRDIPVGADYGDVIDEAIIACRLFVLVFSEPASLSQWVKGEVNLAFTEKKVILPYRIDTAPLKGAMRLILNQMHWVEAYPDAESKFGELVESAERFLGRPASSDAPAAASASSAAPVRTDAAAAPAVAAAGMSSVESVRSETPVDGTVLSAAPVAVVPAAVRRYAVGDYYEVDGKRGIVFEVDESGCRGKIMGLKKSDERLLWSSEEQEIGARDSFDGLLNQRAIERIADWREKYPAFAWCAAQGKGWYLPSSGELLTIYRQRRQLAKACAAAGGDRDLEWVYWSSTEYGYSACAVDNINGAVLSAGNDKSRTCYVRAVCAFSTSAPAARTDAAAAPAVASATGCESKSTGSPTEGLITAIPIPRVHFGCWVVGDYYNVDGKRGIVFEVDESGLHGKIMAMRDAGRPLKWQVRTDTLFVRTIGGSCDDGIEMLACVQRLKEWERAYPAFAYCSSLGRGWYLPTLEELRTMQELRNRLSEACVEHGGEGFTTGRYWSCYNNGRAALAIVFATGYVFDNDKSSEYEVRAVAAF